MRENELIPKLCEIAKLQSSILGAEFKIDSTVRKLELLIQERGIIESLESQLITEEEFADLLLAHFQTVICNSAGIEEPNYLLDYSGLKIMILKMVK